MKYSISNNKQTILNNKYIYTVVMLLFFTLCFKLSIIAGNQTGNIDLNVLTFKESSQNDHEMIQKAIDYAATNKINTVFIPDGEYKIEVVNPRGILLHDNIHLKLSKNAVLKALPNSSPNYSIIRVHDVKGVKITGGKVLGERDEHEVVGKKGEWGMGIDIRNSTNVELSDISINDCWGDAIYLAGSSENVVMTNIICDNNRRQGLSVIAVKGLVVKESIFKNTNGTGPAAGIDLEPNSTSEIITDVLIENCQFINNKGLGLHLYGKYGPVNNVEVKNCIADNNPIGVSLRYEGINNIKLSNIKISNSKTQGLRIFQGAYDIKMSQINIAGSPKNAITITDATNVELSDFNVENYSEGLFMKDSKEIKLKSFNLKTNLSSAKNVDISNSDKVSMIDFNID